MAHDGAFVVRLINILVKNGSVESSEAVALQAAFRQASQETFDEFLLDEGLVDEEDLLRALAEYFQVPAFSVATHMFERALLKKFPKSFLIRNCIIPLEVDEDILVMVAMQPDNSLLLSAIGEYVSYDIQFRVGLRGDIVWAISEFYDEALTESSADVDRRRRLQKKKEAARLIERELLASNEEDDVAL